MDARARIVELEAENVVLGSRVAELNEQVALLVGKVADLEKRLSQNSSNSSKPPSGDAGFVKSNRPENANRATRRAMGRRQGKQPGASGHTLCQVSDPDRVVMHRPARCRGCGRSFRGSEAIGETVRQVFDVPDPVVVVTEHRAERYRCRCGCETTAEFPSESNSKPKLSGEFRSTIGAARFATIRSYISTNRKQAQNIHQHLKNLYTPTPTT